MKPNGAVGQTIRLLEQEIEALEQRRGELLRVIESLRPLAGESARPTHGRPKRALKRNERTNERAKRAPMARPRSLPDVTKYGELIVATLRGNGPMSPADLAKRVKLARPNLTYHMKSLIKSGTVVATGATMNRQFSLPPRSAKEAP